ncbi:MAG: RecX family transcriptional regulator [Saprospiraceae bacterium]|nr:RecX family transcriptional regulator [Saprospiraceae bacterium]
MFRKKYRKYLSSDEALIKLRHYCAYQERCHQEVRYKLIDLGIRGNDLEEIIATLVEEGYLDEERFARSFARGKLRNNGWGKYKILQALRQKKISEYNLNKAQEELNVDEYQRVLTSLLKKKIKSLQEDNPYVVRQKLYKFGSARGFESSLLNEVLNEVIEQ